MRTPVREWSDFDFQSSKCPGVVIGITGSWAINVASVRFRLEPWHRDTLQEAVRKPPHVGIDDRAWASHLATWAAEGFDLEVMAASLGQDSSSDDLVSLSAVIDRAQAIIARMEALPSTFSDASAALTMRLRRNPFDADSVQNEIAAMLLARAPWIPAAERSRARWAAEGRRIELDAWMLRLTTADASSRVEADGVVRAIEAVRPRAEVRRAIEDLEVRQRDREEVLHDLLEILETAGWLVEGARVGTLAQRFDVAGDLQRMDARSREIENSIERRVAAWKPELAGELLERMAEVKQMPDHDLMERLANATDSAISTIASERAVVEEEVGSWNDMGVVLPDHSDDASLFRAHSEDGDAWREAVRMATQASERILEHMEDAVSEVEVDGRLWHAEDAVALDASAGKLDREAELVAAEADATLRVWRAHGIEVGELAERLDAKPRTVAAEVDRVRSRVENSIGALARVTGLDGSIDDDDRLQRWADSLRDLPDEQEMARIMDGIDRLERRQARHRAALDAARHELGGSWPADVDADTLELSSYENLIVALESGTRIEGRTLDATGGEPHEIETWAAEGWDVSGLRARAREDPIGLARDLPDYRRAIGGYDDLVRLLEPLPWGRDPNLAGEVEASLRRPDKLPEIAARRRRIASHLASMRPSGDRPLIFFEPKVESERKMEAILEPSGLPSVDSSGPAFPTEADVGEIPVLSEEDSPEEVIEEPVVGAGEGTVDSETEEREEGHNYSSNGGANEGSILQGGEVETETVVLQPNPDDDSVDDGVDYPDGADDVESPLVDNDVGIELEIQPASPGSVEWSNRVEIDNSKGSAEILARLGVVEYPDLLEIAASAKRDIRVQRLIRLTDLVGRMAAGGVRDALLGDLANGARSLEDWTALRLVNRRSRSGDGLLYDSERLVQRLVEVPGPGAPLPVGVDHDPLPSADDPDGIAVAVAAWRDAVDLPLAGKALANA